MPKIALIGAGSIVFAKNLITDLLLTQEIADSLEISLVDIDAYRLDKTLRMARRMIEAQGSKAKVSASIDRKEALRGCRFVVTTIQVGGFDAYEKDLLIPRKYGVDQVVGDTIGPGGVFRLLRTAPVFRDICRDMEEVCPGALLMNYVNPMSMLTWAVHRMSGVACVGLCHSVQGVNNRIAEHLEAQGSEIVCRVGGINHLSWVTECTYRGQDAYPLLREAMKKPEVYRKDIPRFEMLKTWGAFICESSWHVSEYVPYFRKSKEWVEKINHMDDPWSAWGGDMLALVRDRQDDFYADLDRQIDGEVSFQMVRSIEYGANIVRAMETGVAYAIAGNVMNTGLITNLPEGCCVEVPCLVDNRGITPCHFGSLPPHLASLCRSHIAVHELAVEAAVIGDKEALLHAVLLDPLAGSVLTMDSGAAMVKEMLEAHKDMLPQFA